MEIKNRILGIDFGKKRIGLALSDPLGLTAQPLGLIDRKDDRKDLETLHKMILEHEVEKIVIGLPLNMDGTEGFMVQAVRAFSKTLGEIFSKEIIEMDERLTSRQALRSMDHLKSKQKKQKIDCLSARIILQTYLDSQP